MPDPNFIENDFLSQLRKVIQENIADEMFGVSELAGEISMSRSSLLRKIKKLTNVSASQFIRQVRLQQAMDMLKKSSLTVSEVSFKVGFSSTSYFIKCFREEYGYPPGEVGKKSNSGTLHPDKQAHTHQLVAIMFTDIEGYTALMQKDEEKAITFRKRHRDVFESITNKFNGKILQYFGDGTLSTFHSAIEAVRCGIELQLAFREEPRIPVRIGIHSGDILFSEDGIVGDGVNVASRIESIASAQSVFISEKVYDEIKNQSGIQTTSMGLFELKNVDKPMEVFAIANPGLVVPKKNQLSGKVKTESHKAEKESGIKGRKVGIAWVLLPIAAILLFFILYTSDIFNKPEQISSPSEPLDAKKSIAVLPFRNDSNDSSNVYLINGLMEATLNNLQKIKNLRVISRTSVEKYRFSSKTSPEIARELNVQYLIEGSGQKVGDQISLHIQLIEAGKDEHLWGEQYIREASDIFALQREVAKNITDQIEVIITPAEEERINKAPTADLIAYDFFLKGYDQLYTRTPDNLVKAIENFKKATEHDPEFARAYACIAIAYYYLDEGRAEKIYGDQINHYADQALLYDDKLPQSLIAKGLFYMHNKEYELAINYFEKVLEFNPNENLVYIFLTDVYTKHLPNTEKFLEYGLRGLEIDIGAYDSITRSYIFLQISNAFIQSGFIDEAEEYIQKSLEYFPQNLYAEHLKAYITYARNQDMNELNQLLLQALKKDTTSLDILQDVAKSYYYLRDYQRSYKYYKKFIDTREALKLDIYPGENAKIGMVLSEVGLEEESKKYFEDYLAYANNDQTIYKYLSLSAYYSFMGEKEKSIEQLRIFSQQDNYYYWIILFLDIDPLLDNIMDHPEFKPILEDIESRFLDYHKRMEISLHEKGLI